MSGTAQMILRTIEHVAANNYCLSSYRQARNECLLREARNAVRLGDLCQASCLVGQVR